MPPCCFITCLSATRNVPRYPNRREFKRSLKSSTIPSFGLFINSGSVIVAEQLASSHESYDWLLIDAQHSPVDRTRLESLLTALAVHGCPSLVRVAGPEDRAGIQQALDLGAFGVMVPTVKTVEDAKAVVDSAFFPPLGHRSIAFPIKPQLTRDVSEFISAANDEVLVILQVETSECVDNLNEILNVPGVDATFVGPFDLTFSSGLFDKYGYPSGLDSEELRKICSQVVEVCRNGVENPLVPGIFCPGGVDKVKEWLEIGFTFIGVGTDLGLVESSMSQQTQILQQLRNTAP